MKFNTHSTTTCLEDNSYNWYCFIKTFLADYTIVLIGENYINHMFS